MEGTAIITWSNVWETIKPFAIALLVAFCAYWLWKFIAPYFVRIDNVFYVSGAPGTGKDLLCTNYAIKRYKVARRSAHLRNFVIRFLNLFRKMFKKPLKPLAEMPLFYSSIPVLLRRRWRSGKNELSLPLTLDVLLLKKRLPNGSIVYISDINRFVNQWSYKLPCVQDNIAEFISEFRQYTKGGYFIANSQSSSQVAKEIRNCFGSCINLLHHHHILFLHWSEMRRITLSEDITAIEEGNNDEKDGDFKGNRTNVFMLVNPFFRRYDTYAYYGRVAFMPLDVPDRYKKANTNVFLDLPVGEQVKAVDEKENGYVSLFRFRWWTLVFYLLFSLGLFVLLYTLLGISVGLPFLGICHALIFLACLPE